MDRGNGPLPPLFPEGGTDASPEALYNLGNEWARAGRNREAADAYARALERMPDFPEAHNNLANLLLSWGRFDAALDHYRRTLDLGLDHPLVHYNIGNALKALARPDEAAASFRRALALDPGYAAAHNNLGNVHRAQGRFEAAAGRYLQALAADPGCDEAHVNLASVLYILHQSGAVEVAAGFAETWLREHPGHPMACHMGAALARRGPPPRASDDYVRLTFDSFAREFDETLSSLGYRAPELIAAALARELPEPAGGLDVLDAGCGTGLCGPWLRAYARRLVGVDLSPSMLERAAARGAYDDLTAAELTGFLVGLSESFDLIVAADVLCYFGALEDVMGGLAAALRPGGLFGLTLERLTSEKGGEEGEQGGGTADYTISPHGRYGHAEDYVRRALAAAGLEIRQFSREVLRHEGGAPVVGLLIVAGRRA